ncbi:hypothetical protein FKW77_009428 [Venturia effusa]|uniref:Uncharacterized protein n=1 Tax=Venturia effusa TaxID=50376 RepID=A0A517LD24_9PEZI|nr:hypothetical protein FKW77_009428 [Venturia effusa]
MIEEIDEIRKGQGLTAEIIRGLKADDEGLEIKAMRAEGTVLALMKEAASDEDDMPMRGRGRQGVMSDSSESNDDEEYKAMPDYVDGVDRCPHCGWEIEDGQCADLIRCGTMVKESGDIDVESIHSAGSEDTEYVVRN